MYGYVDSGPILQIDPEGLIIWTGNQIRFDLIVGVGLSLSLFELMSECVDGKQAKVDVIAVGPGKGFGLGTPTFSAGNACFEDQFSNVDPYVFNGIYSSYYAGFTAIVYGAGLEVAVLGSAANCNLFGQGLSFGLSVGYSYVLGSSTVRSVEWRECGCE